MPMYVFTHIIIIITFKLAIAPATKRAQARNKQNIVVYLITIDAK